MDTNANHNQPSKSGNGDAAESSNAIRQSQHELASVETERPGVYGTSDPMISFGREPTPESGIECLGPSLQDQQCETGKPTNPSPGAKQLTFEELLQAALSLEADQRKCLLAEIEAANARQTG